MATLSVGILGPLQVTMAGQPVSLGPRQRVLLAALVSDLGRVVPSTRLAELVWGVPAPERSLVTLRSHISHLRRSQLPLRTHSTADGPGYALDVPRDQVDAHRFARLVATDQRSLSLDEYLEALDLLDNALSLWRGPAFAEVADRPFALAEIARLEGLRRAAQLARSRAKLALGRFAEMAGELEGLVAADPWDEDLRGLFATALHRGRRLADAARVCREGLTLLHEAGLDSPSLNDLQRRILRDDVVASEPEIKSRPGPNTLPAGAARFVGRQAELATLLTAVRQSSGSAVVIAIDGMAGAGKSAFALHASRQLSQLYPGGQLYIDLCGHTSENPISPMSALSSLLGMLGVPADRLADGLANRAAQWRGELAERKVLVVLDNAATAAQLRPLLPGDPGCLTIVTSRRRLSGLDNAVPLTVGGLTKKEAVELLRGTVGDDRCSADAPGTEQMARLCGRLPLAITIAGARLRHRPHWTLDQLVDRLGSNPLPELVAEDRSLASAFAVSYTRLDPEAQRVFRLLALLPAQDFPAPAVAAVSSTSLRQAERILEDLLDVHLIEQPRPARYRLHDLLRHYSAELGKTAGHKPALRSLLDYYLHTATVAANTLDPHRRQTPLCPATQSNLPVPATYAEALWWLDTERAQLVAAVQLAARNGLEAHAWRLARTMGRFFSRRGYLEDWIACGEAAVDAASAIGDRLGEAISLIYLATGQWHRSAYTKAKRLLQRATIIMTDLGDTLGQAAAYEILGLTEDRLGNPLAALGCHDKALALYGAKSDTVGQAHAFKNLGEACQHLGRNAEAVGHYRRSAELFRHGADPAGEGAALTNLSDALEQEGRCEEALSTLQAALALHQVSGNRREEAYALRVLGGVYRRTGRLPEAIASLNEALESLHRLTDRVGEIDVLNDLGEACLDSGESAAVLRHCGLALRLAEQARSPQPQGRAHRLMAHALDALDPEAARMHRRKALEIFVSLGVTESEAVAIH